MKLALDKRKTKGVHVELDETILRKLREALTELIINVKSCWKWLHRLPEILSLFLVASF